MFPSYMRFFTSLFVISIACILLQSNALFCSTSTPDAIVKTLSLTGNQYTDANAIISQIPLRAGLPFNRQTSSTIIKQLMNEISSLAYVEIQEQAHADGVDLLFIVREKPVIKEFIFKGNKQISTKDFTEKLKLKEIRELENAQALLIADKIKKRYEEKGYLNAQVNTAFDVDEANKVTVTFTITENTPVFIKHLMFEGNEHMRSKTLAQNLFSRQVWIGSVIDGSGIYHKERLEADRHMIEQFYQDRGYLNARVVEVKTDMQLETNYATVTFVIKEGDLFTIESVDVSDHAQLPAPFVAEHIPIRQGQTYSRQLIIKTMKLIEGMWGARGYIFAQVDPSVIPNFEDKTVRLTFNCQPGTTYFLRKIIIQGNEKTHTPVILRSIALEENNPLTTNGMEFAKNKIESLGYFDQRDGVNWKIVRQPETEDEKQYADLHLLLKEAKTGGASLQLNFGGAQTSISSPGGGLSVEGNISNRNLFGTGIKVNFVTRLSKEEQNILFNLAQPWLFDKPIYGAIDGYHRRTGYEEFNFTRPVNEIHTGGSATLGCVVGINHELLHDIFLRASIGGERIRYEKMPIASISLLNPIEKQMAQDAYNKILKRLFCPGGCGLFGIHIGQEKRNHPIHPSRGYSWTFQSQTGFPTSESCFGFQKFDLDAHWYTPLINERDLVLHLRGFLGFAQPFERKAIPYRELFHIGGPASVRGFLFGEISPQFVADRRSDSIGGKKALIVSAELIFPITPDLSIKGVCFYDGGAGWDSPFSSDIPNAFLRNNRFDYRHSVGIGVRLLNPMPITIDWGFKLDPRTGESTNEVHFNMSYGW